MKKIAFVLALLLVSGLALAGQNGKGSTPAPNPVRPSNEKKSKPPICEHVCVEWAKNGLCNKTEYRCN